MHMESGYGCYKEAEGVEMSARKAIGIQLYGAALTAVITGLMRAVDLGRQNTMIMWRLTFTSFLICSQFIHWRFLAHIVYLHALSVMYIESNVT